MDDNSFRSLPQTLRVIRESGATGELVCMQAGTTSSIFFRNGRLIHALTRPGNADGVSALHAFLNDPNGRLVFHPAYIPPELTVSPEQEAAFYALIADLYGTVFNPPTETAPLPPPVDPLITLAAKKAPAKGLTDVLTVTRPALLLPPGQINTDVGSDDSPARLLPPLNAAQFSGFVLYDDSHIAEEGLAIASGVLLFGGGALVAAIWNDGERLIPGSDAYVHIVRAQRRGLVRGSVYDVAPPVIEVYRALVDGSNPYSNLDATSANFTGLRGAFKKAGQTGAIKLTYGRLTLYYAIYRGEYFGLYGLDAGGNQLCALPGQVPIALDKPGARLDVFLTRPIVATRPATPAPQPAAPPTPATPADPVLADVFGAIVRVLTNIAPPAQIAAELDPILEAGQQMYPLLCGARPNPADPGHLWRDLHGGAETEAAAFTYVVNALIRPYAATLEPATLGTLVLRALGKRATHLSQRDIRLDCIAAALTAAKTPTLAVPGTHAANPFDF